MRLLLVLGFALLPVGANAADARLQFLGKQLEKATDPRARAQAALMLGQAADPSVLPQLCKALSDKDDVVKAASAKAMDALGELAALDCLKSATGSGDAASAIKTTIANLEKIKNQVPKLYVSLKPPDNAANLPADMIALLEQRLRTKLQRMGAMFAPADEPKSAAQKVLKAKKLKGFMLQTTVEPVGSSGLQLTMVCFSYPENSLKGQVSVKAQGAGPAQLINALAPKAVDDAADEFEWGN
ncbi:MAG: HEAT repeat domain-containing protein [Myxococcaceae bacterium]